METIIDGRGRTIHRPKYVTALGINRVESHEYGAEPWTLLGADVDAAQLASLSANADVSTFPANLDLQAGANLATVQASLEAANLPGDMVTASTTYRLIIRGIVAVFSISAVTPLFGPGVTLDTTLGDLTPEVRTQLKESAESSGYPTTGLTLQSTIREALRKVVGFEKELTILGINI
jgi:hypothetical protein